MRTRPFPWKCPACREKAVQDATVDYRTEIDHDGKTYTIHVPALRAPQCGKCGNIMLTDSANRAISQAFRQEAKLLTPDQIKSSRDELKMTQKELAAYLGVAESTLSRWETGAQVQQKMCDNLLRSFFQVPELREFLGVPVPADRSAAESAEERVAAATFTEYGSSAAGS